MRSFFIIIGTHFDCFQVKQIKNKRFIKSNKYIFKSY